LSLVNFDFFYSSKNVFSHNQTLVYKTEDSVVTDSDLTGLFAEKSSAQRFTRFSNALINYDYKTGHYIGD
jgi:hypothetical protein